MATVGKPFEKGRPKTGGRGKGVANKEPRLPAERLSNRIRRHIDRSMARHEAGIDKISDPAEALRIDARFNRDLVEMLAYTSKAEDTERAGRLSQADVEARAQEAGPLTDGGALAAYLEMVNGNESDQLRIRLARMELGQKGRPQFAHHPGYVALLESVAAGKFECRGEFTLADVLKHLASPPVSVRGHATAETDSQPHAGSPLEGGGRYLPATPRGLRQKRDPYADPPAPGRVIDGERAGRLVAIAAEEPGAIDERDDRQPVPWDDDSVTIVAGNFRSRF